MYNIWLIIQKIPFSKIDRNVDQGKQGCVGSNSNSCFVFSKASLDFIFLRINKIPEAKFSFKGRFSV